MSWVAVAIGGSSLVGAGASLYNGKQARKTSQRSRGESKKILKDFDAYTDESGVRSGIDSFSKMADMFGSEANRSYLDTTEGKAFSNLIERSGEKRRRNLSENVGMMGLTDEAYLSGLDDINQAEGASFSNLVAGADSRRNRLRSQQMAALGQVLGAEQNLFRSGQNRFAQSYNIGGNIAAQGANAQATSNQNMMNLLSSLGSAGAMYFSSNPGGFDSTPGAGLNPMWAG